MIFKRRVDLRCAKMFLSDAWIVLTRSVSENTAQSFKRDISEIIPPSWATRSIIFNAPTARAATSSLPTCYHLIAFTARARFRITLSCVEVLYNFVRICRNPAATVNLDGGRCTRPDRHLIRSTDPLARRTALVENREGRLFVCPVTIAEL